MPYRSPLLSLLPESRNGTGLPPPGNREKCRGNEYARFSAETLQRTSAEHRKAASGNTSAATEGSNAASRTRKKSTDSLTAAGYELFERLRALRLVIAREEGMPPYIIFNDKTLIDMCEKLPVDADTMLSVSGVGQNKLMKYGSRFTEEINKFVSEHPGVVTTLDI